MALTEIYVDPSIAANTGSGTIGDPYGDLQHALNTMTRDATNGNRINVLAGTAEVMAAAIDLTTYGTPTLAAPLVIQGYTSAAGDGGIGEINNGGANISVINSATLDYICFVDMKLGNTGTAQILRLDGPIALVNVELHTSTANSAIQFASGVMDKCWVHDATAAAFNTTIVTTNVYMMDCVIQCGGNLARSVSNTSLSFYLRNIFTVSHTGHTSALNISGQSVIEGNSFYSSVANTSAAILVAGAQAHIIKNNIFTGFSGAGAVAVLDSATSELLLVGSNAFYNNTANVSTSFAQYVTLADITLTNAPFTNAAGGDFSIATAAKAELQAQGWPSSFYGINTNQFLDPGAAQIEIDVASGAHRIFGGLITG